VLPQRRWRHVLLPLEPIYRRQWWKNIGLPVSIFRSLRRLRLVLSRESPALAVGTGGYVSGPALWAAALRGVPTVIQEQNAYPGFATRRLARRARQIHLGFPEARARLRPGPDTEVFDSGNPIQPPPADGRRLTTDGKRGLGFVPDAPLVLVVGGSQGALGINRLVADAIHAGQWPANVQLLWQTGPASYAEFKELSAVSRKLSAFIDPISPAYQAADLVIARAGAITLAEIAAWGLPAILIPLPTAAANHQLQNARTLAGSGAAVLLEQGGLTGPALVRTVTGLLADPAKMADLSQAIRARARPDAARVIAHEALRLVSKR
jgi:UDP-N-acetylglucosamine--N-acetylmuramyl-(pentapeptide) pyrophosphoryl-undecaprenol N-acetylglucosamine transferase